MNPFEFFDQLLGGLAGFAAKKVFAADHRDDPVYLQKLIERNRKLEENEE